MSSRSETLTIAPPAKPVMPPLPTYRADLDIETAADEVWRCAISAGRDADAAVIRWSQDSARRYDEAKKREEEERWAKLPRAPWKLEDLGRSDPRWDRIRASLDERRRADQARLDAKETELLVRNRETTVAFGQRLSQWKTVARQRQRDGRARLAARPTARPKAQHPTETERSTISGWLRGVATHKASGDARKRRSR